MHGDSVIRRHPDTGENLVGVSVPKWNEMLALSIRIAAAVGLSYAGVDLVLDPNHGPLLLEVNARPGLAIQNANGTGLLWRRQIADSLRSCPKAHWFSREAESAQPSAA